MSGQLLSVTFIQIVMYVDTKCSLSARYCCMYCKMSKQSMQLPHKRDTAPRRTLQSLSESYKAYVADGSRKTRAKEISHSVISKSIMPIEVDHVSISTEILCFVYPSSLLLFISQRQVKGETYYINTGLYVFLTLIHVYMLLTLLKLQVVLPTLHISLGIFKKLYDLLENSCHKIDFTLYQLRVQNADKDDDCSNNFDLKVAEEFERQQKLKKDQASKQKELEQVEEELPLEVLQQSLRNDKHIFQGMANRAFTLRQQLQEMVIMQLNLICHINIKLSFVASVCVIKRPLI